MSIDGEKSHNAENKTIFPFFEKDVYRIKEYFKRSGQGQVSLVINKADKKKYALKIISIDGKNDGEIKSIVNEAKLLMLENEYLVKLHEIFKSNKDIFIVMEFAEGGDLFNKLEKQKEKNELFPEKILIEWLIQICKGINFLHKKNILHRDIKPNNIFLTKNNKIKIGDFGISKILKNQFDKANTAIGTQPYLPPEIINNKEYSFKADMWSLGVTLYELSSLELPFKGNMIELYNNIVKGEYKPLPDIYSEEFKGLIYRLLSLDPQKRPSPEDILNMNFIRKFSEKYIYKRANSFDCFDKFIKTEYGDEFYNNNINNNNNVNGIKINNNRNNSVKNRNLNLFCNTNDIEKEIYINHKNNVSTIESFNKDSNDHYIQKMNNNNYFLNFLKPIQIDNNNNSKDIWVENEKPKPLIKLEKPKNDIQSSFRNNNRYEYNNTNEMIEKNDCNNIHFNEISQNCFFNKSNCKIKNSYKGNKNNVLINSNNQSKISCLFSNASTEFGTGNISTLRKNSQQPTKLYDNTNENDNTAHFNVINNKYKRNNNIISNDRVILRYGAKKILPSIENIYHNKDNSYYNNSTLPYEEINKYPKKIKLIPINKSNETINSNKENYNLDQFKLENSRKKRIMSSRHSAINKIFIKSISRDQIFE